jgi:hypothetical protein
LPKVGNIIRACLRTHSVDLNNVLTFSITGTASRIRSQTSKTEGYLREVGTMSNNKQDCQLLSTEEKLEFFIERADALSRYFAENFSTFDIKKIAISYNTNVEGDEWKFHTLTYGLICLIRLFFLSGEKIVLYPIQRDIQKQRRLQPTDVPLRTLSNEPRWCQAVDQAIEAINQLFYGVGTPLDAEPLKLPYSYNGNPVTRLEEFSTIIYGEIMHFNIEKHRTYKQWKKAPDELFPHLLSDFIATTFDISLRVIPPVAEACKQELHIRTLEEN